MSAERETRRVRITRAVCRLCPCGATCWHAEIEGAGYGLRVAGARVKVTRTVAEEKPGSDGWNRAVAGLREMAAEGYHREAAEMLAIIEATRADASNGGLCRCH